MTGPTEGKTRRPVTPAHEPTDGRYKAGCRCGGCKTAHADYTRERRRLALARGTLTHGTRSAYDAGCRCEPCRERRRSAHRAAKTTRQTA